MRELRKDRQCPIDSEDRDSFWFAETVLWAWQGIVDRHDYSSESVFERGVY